VVARPRVLLLEDDPAIQRFVALVAEDCDVEVLGVRSLAAADATLEAEGFDLMLADLMLPDGCAVEWLQRTRQADEGRARLRVVAFSAGLGTTVRHALGLAGVERFLPKPVSVDDLQACFSDLWGTPVAREPDVGRHVCDGCEAAHPASPPPHQRNRAAVVQRYFGGDAQLHADFLQAWRSGLVRELARVEQHLADADLAAVGRMAHSMKSALRMLGESRLARDASLVEQRCAEQTDAGASLAWDRLRSGLQAWMAGRGDIASSA
jgi:CheY-like chemotaxis protein